MAKKKNEEPKKVPLPKRKISEKSVAAKKVTNNMNKSPLTRPQPRKGASVPKAERGFERTSSGLFVPEKTKTPVPASKLRTGFKNAKNEINSVIEEFVSAMTQNYVISEIEFSASFSADGKFMGFGIGGAATIKIKIKPENE